MNSVANPADITSPNETPRAKAALDMLKMPPSETVMLYGNSMLSL